MLADLIEAEERLELDSEEEEESQKEQDSEEEQEEVQEQEKDLEQNWLVDWEEQQFGRAVWDSVDNRERTGLKYTIALSVYLYLHPSISPFFLSETSPKNTII